MATDTRPRLLARLHVPPWLWPLVKWVLILIVVAAVGWEFSRVLRQPDLWSRPWRLRPGLLAAASALYLGGLGFSALYWFLLLHLLGQRPQFLATLRAYYVGQLGRYVPGKVVGLGMRARLLTGPGVGFGVALLTVVYDSLTTIASGVILGLVVLALGASGRLALGWRALGLLAVVGVLLLPGVFNWLADRTTRPFRRPDAPPLPRIRTRALAPGLGITACGWLLHGAALWAVVESLAPGVWQAPLGAWGRCAAYVGLAYAAGFLVLAAPGGLGVRDFLIQRFLAEDLGRTLGGEEAAGVAVLATLLLRLLWTVMDVAAAALCYWLPKQGSGVRGQQP